MKTLTLLSTLFFALGLTAEAAPLSSKEAHAICGAKAKRAARFIFESNRKLRVSYKASEIAEISTPITYDFYVPGLEDSIITVQAYAYPEDRTCTIGAIVHNVAGND